MEIIKNFFEKRKQNIHYKENKNIFYLFTLINIILFFLIIFLLTIIELIGII